MTWRRRVAWALLPAGAWWSVIASGCALAHDGPTDAPAPMDAPRRAVDAGPPSYVEIGRIDLPGLEVWDIDGRREDWCLTGWASSRDLDLPVVGSVTYRRSVVLCFDVGGVRSGWVTPQDAYLHVAWDPSTGALGAVTRPLSIEPAEVEATVLGPALDVLRTAPVPGLAATSVADVVAGDGWIVVQEFPTGRWVLDAAGLGLSHILTDADGRFGMPGASIRGGALYLAARSLDAPELGGEFVRVVLPDGAPEVVGRAPMNDLDRPFYGEPLPWIPLVGSELRFLWAANMADRPGPPVDPIWEFILEPAHVRVGLHTSPEPRIAVGRDGHYVGTVSGVLFDATDLERGTGALLPSGASALAPPGLTESGLIAVAAGDDTVRMYRRVE